MPFTAAILWRYYKKLFFRFGFRGEKHNRKKSTIILTKIILHLESLSNSDYYFENTLILR